MVDYEAKEYYQNNNVAEQYDAQYNQPIKVSSIRARIFGWREKRTFLRLLKSVNIDKKEVLDIASGTGRYIELLLKNGCQAGGVDISNEMLALAQKRIGKHPNLLFLKQGDAENLPFPDNCYDLVTCMRLYHRIPNETRIQMLKEVKRVGKGTAILFFGLSSPWLKYRRVLREKIIPGRHSNPHPVTRKELVNELNSVGMTIKGSKWVLPFFAEGMLTVVKW